MRTIFFLHTISHQMPALHDQIQRRKAQKKLGSKHEQKHQCCSFQRAQKAPKVGPEMHPKSIKIRLGTPGCPCSYGLPWLPKGAKMSSRNGKMDAKGRPNNFSGQQKLPHPLQKSKLFVKAKWKSTSRNQRAGSGPLRVLPAAPMVPQGVPKLTKLPPG